MQQRSDSKCGIRSNRKGRCSVEFDALEARLLWSASPFAHATRQRPPAPHRTAVVVPHRTTKPPKPQAMGAPQALAAAVDGANVLLQWTDNATAAKGYRVLRSIDGGVLCAIATLPWHNATSFSDMTVSPGHTFAYEVQAYGAGKRVSGYSNVAAATLPPPAPTAPVGLAASADGSAAIDLTWSASSTPADGYLLFRSDDGVNFTELAAVNSGTTTSDVDSTVTAGQTYWYRVEAYNRGGESASSNTASASVAALVQPTPLIPTSSSTGDTISITTRFGDELMITASGSADAIALSESGTTLTVTADGQAYSEPVPAAGVFLYTRGGGDTINVTSSVLVRTTIETIDNAATHVTSAGANVSAWIDSTDVFSGTGSVHRVGSFAGGVSKAAGASLPDPSDSGSTTTADLSLWGAGPVAADVNQGEVGDCYFLSSLAAFAGLKPAVLTESAVDMGDGTYVVQFHNGANTTFVRVNGDMPAGPFNGYLFANPGPNDTMWAMVMEKAFAYFRTGENTYASLSGGWMGEAYADLGVSSSDFVPANDSESAFYGMVSTDLAGGKAVTLATSSSAPDLVSDHAYTLVSVSTDSSGVTQYLVRNPWGASGDSLENAQGYATLTFAQLVANFDSGCQATT